MALVYYLIVTDYVKKCVTPVVLLVEPGNTQLTDTGRITLLLG